MFFALELRVLLFVLIMFCRLNVLYHHPVLVEMYNTTAFWGKNLCFKGAYLIEIIIIYDWGFIVLNTASSGLLWAKRPVSFTR